MREEDGREVGKSCFLGDVKKAVEVDGFVRFEPRRPRWCGTNLCPTLEPAVVGDHLPCAL